MQVAWENNGEANADGNFIAVIDRENGHRPTRYVGKSHKEVADKLLVAQGEADKKIGELNLQLGADKPEQRKAGRTPQKRALTSAERMKVAVDIANPASAPEAIKTVVEAEMGETFDQIRERNAREAKEEEGRLAAQASAEFAAENPDWYPSEHNKALLINYMRSMDYAPTRRNFQIAFDHLLSVNLLQVKPNTEEVPAGETAPTPPAPKKERSTGLRSSDAPSGGVPSSRPAPKWTRAKVEAMGVKEYGKLIKEDPEFKRFVDSMQ